MNFLAVKRIFTIFWITICCSAGIFGQSISKDSVTVSPFGKVFVYHALDATPENIIIMISGDGGWKFGVTEFAREFARMKSIVVGVDILRYNRHLRQQKTECYMISSDFVELAAAIERKYNFQGYIPPVVMGYSSGATLVYGILAQARPGTFIGGISLGFCPDFELPQMLCQVNGLEEKEIVKGKSYMYLPDPRLGNPWIALHGPLDKVCDFKTVSDFVQKTANAKLVTLPGVGHGFSKWSNFMPQWKSAYNELILKYSESQTKSSELPKIDDIPCVITREKTPADSDIIAVLFSGDGGWYGFEQSISNRLANKGISVLGIDTRKYFWNRRTPEKTASDISDLLNYYGKIWKKSRYLLMGYSQGAEIVPFVLSRLPDELKSRVVSTVMLSPAINTDFQVHITNMLGLGNRQNTYNVITEISEIQSTRQIIIFGENEKTEVPELLKSKPVEIVRIPGDHHYKSNTALIVQKMEEEKAF